MKVYDFDKTIYSHDSSVDFYIFNLKYNKILLKYLPSQTWAFILYKLKIISKSQMKQTFYRYFKEIHHMDRQVSLFWKHHYEYIRPFYLKQRSSDDIVISAAPTFLLEPLCQIWGCTLIASIVDPDTGKHGMNCYGEEKVKRFRELYPDETIEEFYSDSLSDSPMAIIAEKAFLVSDTSINPWPNTDK